MKTRFNIIDKDEPCYIIAEIGNNHQGKGEDAMQLIRAAAESGANAVKFQKRNVDTLYSNEYFGMEYNGKNSFGATYGAHRRLLEPDLSWLSVANKLAQELHLDFVVTVFDIESLLLCEEQLSIDAYKIQSGDMTNHCLIKAVANTGKPYFISSGASSLDEITASFDLCSKLQTPFIMLYAVSSYPTTANKTNLYRFKQMQKLLDTETLGLSCHYPGIEPALLSRTMGAVVIEKHLTLDKSQKGSDHAFSLLPEECLELRKRLEQIDEFMGIKFPEDSIEDHQQDARYKLGKSAVSKKHRNKGETIQEEDVCYVSPAAGLTPAHFSSYIGKSLVQEIKMGDYFTHLHFAAFKSEDYFS